HGIRMPAQEGAKLLDGAIEVAHLIEGEPEAFPGIDQVGLNPERLAKRRRGAGRVAAPHGRATECQKLARPRVSVRAARRRAGAWRVTDRDGRARRTRRAA